MCLYPVFLSLTKSDVLVAGAGKVGRRKIASLAEAQARSILVIDPNLCAETKQELESIPGVRLLARRLEATDLAGKALVFAATDDEKENARIAGLCASASVPCNVADDPDNSSFLVPAQARAGDLTAAFSTGGRSPALAGRIRREAEDWLRDNYGPLLIFMGRLRPLVLELDLAPEKNGELFRSVVYSGLGDALCRRDRDTSRECAAGLLPSALHGRIEELLHGLC